MNIDYIAGFFDGEGSITYFKQKVRTQITQTNKEVLDQIKDFFGFGAVIEITKRKAHWKDCWVYYTGGNIQSYKVLCLLDGHLIVKQKKLEEAKKILEGFFEKKDVYTRKKMEAVSLISQGLTYREIEKLTGISRSTVCNEVKKIRGT